MSDRVPPIARIRLSRSLPRLLILPLLMFVVGAAAIAGGLALLSGTLGLAVAGLGGVVILGALIGALVLLSVRLDIEEAAVCLGWLGGERIYPLSPGPVTRVRLRGRDASRLRASPRLLPWQLGNGRLRGEEDVEVVRLAPSATAILVPTERGRLAIAAADETELLEALSRAARARQRLEDLTREAPPVDEPMRPLPAVDVEPALMTGIQRAVFEGRMAQERAAAVTAAEAERLAATGSAEAIEGPAAAEVGESEPKARRRRLPRPSLTIRPGPSLALLVLPLVAAGTAWGLAVLLDRMPEPGTDLGRLTALALVLAGPATTVGAIMARVYWPRLVAVVVAGGLATSVFVGRALLG
ncbi:MAG TPA: hypothetical protein VEW95_04640 [Candidatus Limnocylindrales bacterium]|nr:hypothetical protein [Candidatus Limnocylindrales bacterium]